MEEYEYRGLMALTWDLFRGDTSNWSDRRLYWDLVRRYGQPVLDVGCGTGRILLDFASKGIDIDGMDNSPEMLELCRRKADTAGISPTIVLGTMETLQMPRRYQTILVPSSSFQLLTAPGAAALAMQRLVEHLLPGGVLVMPFMNFWREGDPLDTGFESAGEVTLSSGEIVKRFMRSLYDPANQWENTETRYELWRRQPAGDGYIEEKIGEEFHRRDAATRNYTQTEAVELYRGAGLVDISVLHDFTHEPATPESAIITMIGRKEG